MRIINKSTHVDIDFNDGESENNVMIHVAFELVDQGEEHVEYVPANNHTDLIWYNYFHDNDINFNIKKYWDYEGIEN